jgi:hypothetical protein
MTASIKTIVAASFAAAAIALTAGCASTEVASIPTTGKIELKTADTKLVEAMYWKCISSDAKVVAAGQMMGTDLLAMCSSISKELQVRKFGDDFGALHAWTNANKASMIK